MRFRLDRVVVVALVAVTFALVTGLIVLRFMYLARQMVDSMRMDRQESATRLDAAHATAFTDAMTALELVTERVTAQQTSMFERTVDMVAGPQGPTSADAAFAVDNPSLDARARWVPDDEFDYTSLGIDPTDDDMPLPRLEPEGNEHRATMVRPGEGLMPS